MLIKNIIFWTIIILGFLGLKNSQAIIQDTQNIYCPQGIEKQINFKELTDSAELKDRKLSFDATTHYYNPDNGDSVPLMIKFGSVSDNYKFIHFNNNYEQETPIECPNSAGLDFVVVLEKFLFLKNSTSNIFYVCKFDKDNAVSLKQLGDLPDWSVDTLTAYVPYHVTGDEIWVFASTATQSGIYLFTWSLALSVLAVSTCACGKFNFPGTNAIGNQHYIWIQGGTAWKLKYINTDGLIDWKDDNNIPSPVGKILKAYPLRQSVVLISILQNDRLSGTLHTIVDDFPQITNSPTSTTQIVQYSDFSSNFITMGSNKLFWVYMKAKFTIIIAQIDSPPLDYTNIKSIALSGNKATLLYSDKLNFLRNDDGVIKQMFTKNLQPGQIDLESASQQRLSLSCLCSRLKTFSCRSSTLNCLIEKFRINYCLTVDDITP